MKGLLTFDTRARRVVIGVGIYFLVTAIFLLCAAPETLRTHTPYNHFALLAEAWKHGHFYLNAAPPRYAGNNDFAKFGDRWFVVFPAFPAALIFPLVYFAGSAEAVRDGQFFVWLAGIGPAVLFLCLEKLRRTGRSERDTGTNVLLSLLFAFGTVYFFSAVQGTVWFAAHVVGVGLTALYLLFALDAERPFLAGLMLVLGFWTRTPIAFAFPLFVCEAWRIARAQPSASDAEAPASGESRIAAGSSSVSWKWLGWSCAAFGAPVLAGLALALWHNQARFGSSLEFGYQYLTVAWQARMQKWGLFSYHFLARNLSVVLASLPWTAGEQTPFRINMHGLALWFTTPIYLWLIWPKNKAAPHLALWLTVAAVAVPTLFYQNTGWEQFGYRFSNDYAVYLFALLAINGRRFKTLFWGLAIWAVVVNAFGALTFQRDHYRRFYYSQPSQKALFEPD